MTKIDYIIFPSFIDNNLLIDMNNGFLDNNKVNYSVYDILIKRILGILAQKLNWQPIALKYRVSEGIVNTNSNATDASNFHRDINIFYNYPTPDIFTLVIYLDEVELEIIPNSKSQFNSLKLNKPKKYKFRMGDAILFNSSTLHRGVFENSYNKTRKCIQIFEIFKNEIDFRKYKDKILTLPGNKETVNEYINNFWFKIPLLNKYIKKKGSDIYSSKIHKNNTDPYYNQYYYLSPEAQRPRVTKDIDIGNFYRIIININDSVHSKKDYNNFIKFPIINAILADFLILIFMILIIILISKYIAIL